MEKSLQQNSFLAILKKINFHKKKLNLIEKKTLVFIIISLLAFTHNLVAQVQGCTDLNACNFNSVATTDDGSCTYAVNINLDMSCPDFIYNYSNYSYLYNTVELYSPDLNYLVKNIFNYIN